MIKYKIGDLVILKKNHGTSSNAEGDLMKVVGIDYNESASGYGSIKYDLINLDNGCQRLGLILKTSLAMRGLKNYYIEYMYFESYNPTVEELQEIDSFLSEINSNSSPNATATTTNENPIDLYPLGSVKTSNYYDYDNLDKNPNKYYYHPIKIKKHKHPLTKLFLSEKDYQESISEAKSPF